MIGRLRGSLEAKNPPFLLVDVNGVGYELQAPLSTIYRLPPLSQPVVLFTHLHVREDAELLYGFMEEQERSLFRALIKVSGVGPKLALTILSGMDVKTFIQCVERREITALTSMPGVGKKTAERLIIEMSGKLKNSFEDDFDCNASLFQTTTLTAKGPEEEAVSALIALGYKPQEASKAIANITSATPAAMSSQDIIRKALQNLAKA